MKEREKITIKEINREKIEEKNREKIDKIKEKQRKGKNERKNRRIK